MNEPTLTDTEVNELYRRWQQKVNFTYMLDAVERIVAARVAEAVDRERASSLRPWEADLLIEDAVDRERAAWATKVREAADRYHANGCHYRHQQGDTDECNSCTAFDIEALLAADDTEGTP